jgi:hypothetical protein
MIEEDIHPHPLIVFGKLYLILNIYSAIKMALINMNWTICIAPSNYFFLTSDNPVFFFPEIGVGGTPYANLLSRYLQPIVYSFIGVEITNRI